MTRGADHVKLSTRMRRWLRLPPPAGTVYQHRNGRYSDETREQFARRMGNICPSCGRAGHLMCWDKIEPGESVSFALDLREDES